MTKTLRKLSSKKKNVHLSQKHDYFYTRPSSNNYRINIFLLLDLEIKYVYYNM